MNRNRYHDSVDSGLTLNSTLPSAGAMNYTQDADDRLGSDQYDPDGNTINSGGIANTYDFENHAVTHGGVTIAYDGDGNRVKKTEAGVTTTYLVDTQNPTGYAQVVFETYSGNSGSNYEQNHSFVYGLERISRRQLFTSNLSYYVYDGHGSVRALTDSTGAVTDTYDYDAFGNLIHSTGATPNVYLFSGEQYDSDLHLYYNRARYLNVSTGRFWTMDSFEGDLESPPSLHKYLYAEASPVNLKDPNGTDGIVDFAIAAAVISAVEAFALPQITGELPIQVRQIEYNATSNGMGVAIELGARTRNRLPVYPEYRWVQFITTNDPAGGAPADTPYNDPQPPDDDKPFYYTDAEEPLFHNQLGYDYVFTDTPWRPLNDIVRLGTIRWHADLSLTGVSPAGSVNYTPIVRISYGFTLDNRGVTLEPLAIGR